MTAVSTIFDNLVSKVGTTLTTYKRLPNPYLISQNNDLYLKAGYGIAFGPGNRTDLHVGCRIAYERIFNIILVNQITTTEHNTAQRETLEKNLLEDFIRLRIALEQDHTLSGSCIKLEYGSDSGIEFSLGEESKFISINLDCLCLYEENLT